MNIKQFSNEIFVKTFGEIIREIRLKKCYTQEFVAYEVCDRATINKLENGNLKIFDIGIAIKITNKLGLSIDKIINRVLSLLNTDYKIINCLFHYLNNCDFHSANNYYLASSTQEALGKNSKIDKYYKCANLFREEKYSEILTLLVNEIKSMPNILAVVDILLGNCYILAHLNINYENEKSVISIDNFITLQRASIEFYIDFYPHIMIRMLINLVDYYRINCLINESLYILDSAEKYCNNFELYDSLFDIYFNKLIINIQFYYGKNAKEYFDKIDSYFKSINKKLKREYIRKKYDYIKSLYINYCDVKEVVS